MRNRSISLALALSLSAFAVLSCSWFGLAGQGGAGSLALSISDPLAAPVTARTVAPASDLTTVTAYVLDAYGPSPGNRHIGPVNASLAGHTFTDLEAGSWTFSAVGKNAYGNPVTGGSASATIADNVSVSRTIYMNPASGDGTYSVTVTWIGVPGVSHIGTSLTTLAGAAATSPTIGSIANGMGCSGTLPSGMYKLRLQFTNGQRSVWISELLQIFGGLASQKAIALSGDHFIAPPPAPDGLSASALNRAVVLAWNDNSGDENGFILEKKVGSGSWTVLCDTISANAVTHTDSAVDFAHTYAYRISSTSSIGDSAPSAEAAFSPVRVTGVSLGADFYLHAGGAATMTATVSPANAFDQTVTWNSSAPAIAEIDPNTGTLTAKSPGQATIQATTLDGGKTATRVVTVTPVPAITSFGFSSALNSGLSKDCAGSINGTTINVFVPFGTDRSALKATFASNVTGTGGLSSVKVGTTEQVSGTTPNNFTGAVTYIVTGPDGYSVNHTVSLSYESAGMASITFTPNPHITVAIGGLPKDWLKTGDPIVLSALTTENGSAATVDSYQWYVDQVPVSGTAGSGSTFTVTTGLGLDYGSHRLGVQVRKGVYAFSAEATLNVVKTLGIATSSGPATTIEPSSAASTVTYYKLKATGQTRTIDWFTVPVEGCTISDLEEEIWTIDAVGYNAANQPVTLGTTGYIGILAGETTSETIEMGPNYPANGSCAVTVSWAGLSGVSYTGYALSDANGNAVVWSPAPTATPNGAGIDFAGTLSMGMYRLRLGFTDGLKPIGVCETLQVFGGLQSVATIALAATDFSSPPAAPSGLAVTSALDRQATLGWNDNSSTEDGFILERKVDSGAWDSLATVSANVKTWIDTAVSYDHVYDYRIRSTNAIGDSAWATELVFDPVNVTSVSIGADFFLHLNGTRTMTATLSPADAFDKRVTWSSSAPAIAEVNADTGLVTAKAIGQATITATALDSLGGVKTGSSVVTVSPYPAFTSFGFTTALNAWLGMSSDSPGTIYETDKSIAVTVPYGTDPTKLKATFASTVNSGVGQSAITVSGIGAVTSGASEIDFTSPVTYNVVAADGFFVSYVVTLSYGQPGSGGIVITPNPQLTVDFSGMPATWVEGGADVVVTAVVTGGTPDSYEWYLDWVKQAGTGSTFTIGSSLGLSRTTHRLAVYVKKDGYYFAHEASFTVLKPVARAIFGREALAALRFGPPEPIEATSPGRPSRRGGMRHA